MEKVRLGILGPGRIVRRVMTDMGNCRNIELTAIASRDLSRAQEACREYGVPFAYGSYEELAASREVDLVYIATPNPFHEAQARLMMEHGKAVLCEKPLALDEAEAARMAECAKKNGVFFMEAMWTRFLPAIRKVRELVLSGAIGQIRHVFAEFAGMNRYDPQDRLFSPELGGGALLDLGVYTMMTATLFLGYHPAKVRGSMVMAPTGVDLHTTVEFTYENGATAQLFEAFDTPSRNDMILYGSQGTIYIPEFWRAVSFTLCQTGQAPQEFTFAPEHEGHHYEFDHAAECMRSGLLESPVVTWDESIEICRINAAIRHENGLWYPQEEKRV